MMEMADMPDLKSGAGFGVRVQVSFGAPVCVVSSVGRALESCSKGRGFESLMTHQKQNDIP